MKRRKLCHHSSEFCIKWLVAAPCTADFSIVLFLQLTFCLRRYLFELKLATYSTCSDVIACLEVVGYFVDVINSPLSSPCAELTHLLGKLSVLGEMSFVLITKCFRSFLNIFCVQQYRWLPWNSISMFFWSVLRISVRKISKTLMKTRH